MTRGSDTLPASQVPNLAPGDRLWIKADLPDSQSVALSDGGCFLAAARPIRRPKSGSSLCKTWTEKCGQEGLTVTVPQRRQQVLLFLAPETGGDFRTLVSAVRGRPGAFVRTSQDLNQAALDRSRLEQYPGGGARPQRRRSRQTEGSGTAAGAQPCDQSRREVSGSDP